MAKQKAEEAEKQQQQIDQAVQQNCLDAINKVEYQIIRQDPDSFEIIKSYPELVSCSL